MLIHFLLYGFMLSMLGLVGIPLFVMYRQVLAKRYNVKRIQRLLAEYSHNDELHTYAKAELADAKKRPFWKWNIHA